MRCKVALRGSVRWTAPIWAAAILILRVIVSSLLINRFAIQCDDIEEAEQERRERVYGSSDSYLIQSCEQLFASPRERRRQSSPAETTPVDKDCRRPRSRCRLWRTSRNRGLDFLTTAPLITTTYPTTRAGFSHVDADATVSGSDYGAASHLGQAFGNCSIVVLYGSRFRVRTWMRGYGKYLGFWGFTRLTTPFAYSRMLHPSRSNAAIGALAIMTPCSSLELPIAVMQLDWSLVIIQDGSWIHVLPLSGLPHVAAALY
ncbi:hypothetical protein KC333_g222 [Hortaea werneckii]|nr:hypothetical protein KC333_g222 [Hortaea werneckii]